MPCGGDDRLPARRVHPEESGVPKKVKVLSSLDNQAGTVRMEFLEIELPDDVEVKVVETRTLSVYPTGTLTVGTPKYVGDRKN